VNYTLDGQYLDFRLIIKVMNKLAKNEDGFGVFEIISVIIIVVLLCVVGWLVYSRQHKSSSSTTAVTTTKQTHSTASSQPAAGTAQKASATVEKNYSTWNSVPGDMQTAILAAWQSQAPNGCPSSSYQSAAQNSVSTSTPLVTYGDQFMVAGVGCDGGAANMFVKTAGAWKDVASAQGMWNCSMIQQYDIPTALLQAENVVENAGKGNGLPVMCLNSSGNTQTIAS